ADPAPSPETAQEVKPEKRIRNLRKKLAEIETLEEKDPNELSEEQLQKIGRKSEMLEEVEELEKKMEELKL
ncbi:wibg, partial [Symbiodinium microadriaticum]